MSAERLTAAERADVAARWNDEAPRAFKEPFEGALLVAKIQLVVTWTGTPMSAADAALVVREIESLNR